MQVSLICTVKNEADNIAELIESMLAQSRAPDEIVINDCGSSDDTASIVRRFIEQGAPIRLVAGGYNIASGRNNAVRHARGPIIASTDAGLTLDRHWLAHIVAPIEQGEAELVGGFYMPAPRSLFEMALGATNFRDAEEAAAASFLPAGQSVAFRKEAWVQAGGYPEWADHCEDLIFDMEVLRRGYRLAFVPEALIWFRPRRHPGEFFRQYYNYARGDGLAGLWPLRHTLRYATYLALLGVALPARRYPALLLLLLPGMIAYTARPYRRLWRRTAGWSLWRRLAALPLVPALRLLGDLAKMLGYPAGRLLRKTRRPA